MRKLYLVRRVQFQWYKYLRPFNEQPKNLEEETKYDMIKLFRSKIEGQNSPTDFGFLQQSQNRARF